MSKIIIHLKNEQHEFDADHVSEIKSFLNVYRKENLQEKSYTEGHLWWKRTRTHTEYTPRVIGMFATKFVTKVEINT